VSVVLHNVKGADQGIWLFCDEVYRGIEVGQARTLPQAADRPETGVAQRRFVCFLREG